jgi:hypothetical protein
MPCGPLKAGRDRPKPPGIRNPRLTSEDRSAGGAAGYRVNLKCHLVVPGLGLSQRASGFVVARTQNNVLC